MPASPRRPTVSAMAPGKPTDVLRRELYPAAGRGSRGRAFLTPANGCRAVEGRGIDTLLDLLLRTPGRRHIRGDARGHRGRSCRARPAARRRRARPHCRGESDSRRNAGRLTAPDSVIERNGAKVPSVDVLGATAGCKHFASIRASTAMSPCSAQMQRLPAILAWNPHLAGIRRNAYTYSRRLITGGRRFKSCPRYWKAPDTGPFCSLELRPRPFVRATSARRGS